MLLTQHYLVAFPSTDASFRHSLLSESQTFFYFLPSNKSNVENLIKLTTLFKAHIALLVI